ncbi:ferredoxin family 2Fe-2S iron-sulfur cluster binding protein [Kordiimonas aquimaris]|uniref:ferredoxin family 2Fe-2S iron-sulfur cluster binding protein n=1 Tax=Kordiimonas aquimaris TaxID=707591 RepID=UPI0021D2829B|nr:ferredoxin family 2Fe-2S iron-sulfur cluster binding protein [Kordiimonas aquimaris]
MSDVTVVFVTHDGNETMVKGPAGSNVLTLAHMGGIDIEGACEGNMACSTCHVIVEDAFFEKLSEASEDEEEMLDLATGLRRTSRLGCQIIVENELDGLRLHIPRESRNMMGL